MDPSIPAQTFSSHEANELIVELDRLEARLSFLTSEVARLEKAAVLGEVSAFLAHEFNNLLTPLVAYAEHAKNRLDRPDVVGRALETIHRNALQAERISQSILNLAKGSGGGATADVGEVIEQAVLCLGRESGRDGITISAEVPRGTLVQMDSAELQQVLLNLLLNARKAILQTQQAGRITLRVAEGERRVRIEVVDTGVGMTAEVARSLFGCAGSGGDVEACTRRGRSRVRVFGEDSQRDKTENLVSGLGLVLCRRLVDKAQGTLYARSKPGEGTVMAIVLPRA
jgi:signal transduction histidine kinase